MAQEYFINSSSLQSKVDSLLPSQGGAGAGFDLSASTQIIPVIDLTESAEGSQLRADLQTAFGFATDFNNINNSTVNLVTTTGFFRVFGNSIRGNVNGAFATIFMNDGATDKIIYSNVVTTNSVSVAPVTTNFDFIVFLRAGDTLKGSAGPSNLVDLNVATRQIASIDGTLTNPLGFS